MTSNGIYEKLINEYQVDGDTVKAIVLGPDHISFVNTAPAAGKLFSGWTEVARVDTNQEGV